MCGIAGILTNGKGFDSLQLKTVVQRMIGRMEHRGPDDESTWISEGDGIGLGFRRLAILDLSVAGRQPMTSASGQFVCVFNGEIYNYAVLRRELEADGVRFRGRSDTEVLVAAIQRWGLDSAVRRLIGMFAFALWDTHNHKLHLVRDRLGIKPLFVYTEPGFVVFASELKSILAVPGLDLTIDRGALLAYLRRLYIPEPRSVFNRVRKLAPAHILSLSASEPTTSIPVPYWSLVDTATSGLAEPVVDHQGALESLEEVLRDSVRLRMVSDVPLGAFLSGGIDSSLVVALMQELSDRPVKTFTIGFDNREHNEAPYASAVARHLGTDHHEYILGDADARALVLRLPDYFDEPFASSSAIPNMLVCAVARRDVTVALSGVGGDEVFGGYNRYTQLSRAAALLGLPAEVRRLLSRILKAVAPDVWTRIKEATRFVPGTRGIRLLDQKVLKLAESLLQEDSAGLYRVLTSAWYEPSRFLPDATMPEMCDDRILEDLQQLPRLVDRAMLSDQLRYLPDDQLVVADRTSMAASLELRVPLLDHRLLELTWRFPPSLKVQKGRGKIALRTLLSRRVPKELFERPKVGFSVPLRSWLRGPLREWASDLLEPTHVRRRGMLNARAVEKAWSAFLSTGRGSAQGIWTLVMVQAWAARWDVSQ